MLISRVTQLCNDLENSIENAGIVLSRVGRPALHRKETEASIRETFKDLVLDPIISERSPVSEAAQANKSIFEFNGANAKKAKEEFELVCEKLLENLGISDEDA